uniref:Uncharacterized protein n=1 Tax=Arundo donax TaxID=35708 RepID=A0A0A9C8C2_ARUDO
MDKINSSAILILFANSCYNNDPIE